ncbi:MAG: hypothetical protein O2905_02950 [Proteobacteria bacterium]|nr:hypothetical protein [Pseudomonadota bacterium]
MPGVAVYVAKSNLIRAASLVLLAVAFGFVTALPAAAQNADIGRRMWIGETDCKDCHGWAANGIPDEPRSSKGANLRETILTVEQISETILCGRPGTGMPHYDARAYNDDRCYGLTREQLGPDTPSRAAIALVKRHADSLAMFIVEHFKDAGPPTLAECIDLMGAESIRCDALR